MSLVKLYERAEQVESDFYQAFGTGDFELMASLYADSGVSYKHMDSPNIIGREKVIDNWEFILEGIPHAKIDIEVISVSSYEGIEVRKLVESVIVDEDSGERSEVCTTTVYILQENGWKIKKQNTF